MKITNNLIQLTALIGIVLGLMVFTVRADALHQADSLYIGDGGDDSVKRFNARTGTYLGPLVSSQSNGLLGPMGLLSKGKELLVVNQNLEQPFNGEVLRFNRSTGEFNGALVPCRDDLNRPCDPDSPFAPRGLIKGQRSTLFVADLLGPSFDFQTQGSIKQYDFNTGQFVRNLDISGFTRDFFPRGVVIGPDDKLYVSVVGVLDPSLSDFDPLAGYILRFNPKTGKFIDVFASYQPASEDCSKHFHRPEGLSFGSDGKLYVTSFRADPTDTDKILVFSKRGKCIDQIDLYQAGQPRAFAQALIFGPSGGLFVPINNTGEVRRYNVKTKTFDVFVPSVANGGPLLNPWYLTFGETNPSTLKYSGD
jgi:DNA-binding beta-propeller fold protein YncE